MVNTGRPSTGCHTCRKRKVKCDEARPGCKRCAAICVVCPGYRDTNNTHFVRQTEWAKKKVELRLGGDSEIEQHVIQEPVVQEVYQDVLLSPPPMTVSPKPPANSRTRVRPSRLSRAIEQARSTTPTAFGASSAIATFDAAESCAISAAISAMPRGNVSRNANTDAETFAVARFFTEWVVDGGAHPFLDFLPEMSLQPNLGKCFQHALPAVALANAASRWGCQDLALRAQFHYGLALSAMRDAMLQYKTNPELAKADNTMTAVFLLSFYELFTISYPTLRSYDKHAVGRSALLSIKLKDTSHTLAGVSTTYLACTQVLWNCFLDRVAPSSGDEQMAWTLQMLPTPTFSNAHDCIKLHYATVEHISKLNDAMTLAKASSGSNIAELNSLLNEGIALDEELKRSTSRLDDICFLPEFPFWKRWCQNKMELSDCAFQELAFFGREQEDDNLFPQRVLAVYLFQWHHGARIHLLQILHEAADMSMSSPGQDFSKLKQYWCAASRECVDFVLVLVLQIFADLDAIRGIPADQRNGCGPRGFYVLFLLRTALFAAGTTRAQRELICRYLDFIGNDIGIVQANAFASLSPDRQAGYPSPSDQPYYSSVRDYFARRPRRHDNEALPREEMMTWAGALNFTDPFIDPTLDAIDRRRSEPVLNTPESLDQSRFATP